MPSEMGPNTLGQIQIQIRCRTFFKCKYQALKSIKYKYSLSDSNTNTISLKILALESTLFKRMYMQRRTFY